MSAWTLHHIVASCQDCDWWDEIHGASRPWRSVLDASRSHARLHRHYVQVERGQHAHYDERRPDPADEGERR